MHNFWVKHRKNSLIFSCHVRYISSLFDILLLWLLFEQIINMYCVSLHFFRKNVIYDTIHLRFLILKFEHHCDVLWIMFYVMHHQLCEDNNCLRLLALQQGSFYIVFFSLNRHILRKLLTPLRMVTTHHPKWWVDFTWTNLKKFQ